MRDYLTEDKMAAKNDQNKRNYVPNAASELINMFRRVYPFIRLSVSVKFDS